MKIEKYLEISSKKEEINEIAIETFLTAKAIFAIYLIIQTLVIITKLGLYYTHAYRQLKGSKSESYSQKLSDIVESQVNVKRLTSDTVDILHNAKNELGFTTAAENLFTEYELIALLLHEYGKQKSHADTNTYSASESTGIAVGIFLNVISLLYPPVQVVILLFGGILQKFLKFKVADIMKKNYTNTADSFAKEKNYGNELVSAMKKFESHIRENVKKKMNIKDVDKIEKKVKEIEQEIGGKTFQERIDKILNTQAVQNIIKSTNFKATAGLYSILTKNNLLQIWSRK